MTRDCSDEYKAWDNTEIASVTLKSVWDPDIKSFISRQFNAAVVRRTSNTDEFPNFNEVELASESQVLLIAAATIEGGPVAKGDVVCLSDSSWIVSDNVYVARAGSSVSHFKAICFEMRG